MTMLAVFILAATTALSSPAYETRADAVQAALDRPAPKAKEWAVSISLYGWLTGFSVDADGDRINASFGDVLDILNSGMMLRSSARWRRFTGYADYLYGDLGDSTEVGPGVATLSVIQHNGDLRLGYVVWERADADSSFALIVEGGARWWYTRVTVEVDIPPLVPGGSGLRESFRDTSQWWDPLVGVRVHWKINPRAFFVAHFNYGGFGIGEASDYVWDLGFVFSFRIGKGFSVPLGYRALQYSRNDGGVDLTTTMQGPIIGISFTF